MLRSLRFYTLCLLLGVAILSVGCAFRPSALHTRSWTTPCDTCIKSQCDKEKCIEGVENFSKVITDTLWRGAQPTSEGFCNLQAAGVKTIVNLRYDHDDLPFLAGTGLRYFWIKTHAWNPEIEDIVKFLKVINDEKNWPIFVHCAAGKDRTGYTIAAYRIIEQNWTADDAIHEMFDFGYHPWWFRNPGFLRDKIEEDKVNIRNLVEKSPPLIPEYAIEGTCKYKK